MPASQIGMRAVTVRAFGEVQVAAHRVARSRVGWSAEADAAPAIVVVLPRDGRVGVEMQAGAASVPSSACAVFLSASAPDLVFANAATFAAVTLPIGAVPEAAVRRLPLGLTDAAPALALGSFAVALLAHDRLPAGGAAWIEQHLRHLCLEVIREADEAGRDAGSLGEQARVLMLRRRADPLLTPAVVADELHVSMRQLQRLFAREGDTPADFLSSARVQLAAKLLCDDPTGGMRMRDVSVLAGFSSAAAMRRAFVRHVGSLPLATRDSLRASGAGKRRNATGKA